GCAGHLRARGAGLRHSLLVRELVRGASLEIICPALTRRRSRCSLARQAVAPVPAERGRLCRFSKPECRRGWSCPTAKASPAVWHALRDARNHPRFEASSAWIFRPSYHRQDCALSRFPTIKLTTTRRREFVDGNHQLARSTRRPGEATGRDLLRTLPLTWAGLSPAGSHQLA